MFRFKYDDLTTHNPNILLKKVASAIITVDCGITFLGIILSSFNCVLIQFKLFLYSLGN